MAIFPSPDDLMIDFRRLKHEHLRDAQNRRSIHIARSHADPVRPRPRFLRLRHALTGAFTWRPALAARSSPAAAASREAANASGN